MQKLDDETRDRILTETVRVVAAIAKAIAPLIENTEQRPGLMGGSVPNPSARDIAAELVSDTQALLKSLPADSVSSAESHRLAQEESL